MYTDILLSLITITMFLGLSFLFFWYFSASAASTVGDYYLDIYVAILKNSPELQNRFLSTIQSKYNSLSTEANQDDILAIQSNYINFTEKVIPYYVTFFVLTVVYFWFLVYKGHKLNTKEIVFLSIVICSFIPEIYVYLVLLNRWVLEGDLQYIYGIFQ